MDEIKTAFLSTPIGLLEISAQAGLITNVHFTEAKHEVSVPDELLPVANQLEDYFSAKTETFDFELSPAGTTFQKDVWKIVQEIPYGQTRSYGDIATQMGMEKGARAIGLAVGANPLLIVIPCHRVLGKSGKLTGYAGGMERKQWLLRHEAENTAFQLKI